MCSCVGCVSLYGGYPARSVFMPTSCGEAHHEGHLRRWNSPPDLNLLP